MDIEKVRNTLIEVIKNIEKFSDRELVEIINTGDKMKEMAMYEKFRRERITNVRN
ncbi:hypothetical protein [Streptococcus agalactiae]|uniref:hypothetical protein n=1 Tax=Streptococcus agalactiae TaxID=1311 RepID=UPI0015B6F459|nr:hypothetical protein [Streptococcus agalactiae]